VRIPVPDLSPETACLGGLLLLSAGAFLATARWHARLASDRALTACSIAFSLALVALALVTGLAVLR